ncbi:MAG: hypothetical protein ACLFPP_10660 [Spirochaetaceae bacterium]
MRPLFLVAPGKRVISYTDPRFLSVALDWALVVGERWWEGTRRTRRGFGSIRAPQLDLSDPRLISAAASLEPAYLRLGGSESDRMAFGGSPARGGVAPPPAPTRCPTILTPERWDQTVEFASAARLELFVCVGAGECARDHRGAWRPDSFRRFLNHVSRRGDKVAVWELGNEVNGFPFVHGPSARVSPRQYAEDYTLFRETIEELLPRRPAHAGPGERALAAGPASAVWPVIGEPLPMTRAVTRRLGSQLDMLTWHYYPYQSRRGIFGVRRVGFHNALWSRAHRSAVRLAGRMRRFASENGSGPVWLSETGHALFGGQPGVSDRFVGSLWWLDHLGSMAAAGMSGLVRQALVGGDYGLLDQEGLRPRPDFWCCLLWKRLMGERVYEPLRVGRLFTVYRHGRADSDGGWSALAVNMSRRRRATLELPRSAEAWWVDGPLRATGLIVNEKRLGPGDEPSLATIPDSVTVSGAVTVPPSSALFLEFGPEGAGWSGEATAESADECARTAPSR